MAEPKPLVAFADPEADRAAIEAAARRLGLTVVFGAPDTETFLQISADGVSLNDNGLSVRGDFERLLPRLKPNNLNGELLVRAAKIKGAKGAPTAVDATAGLGEDSLLLAAAGFSVRMFEHNRAVSALLRDALFRAAQLPELEETVGRMELFTADSLTALPSLDFSPDVVFLDPMFPARQKSSLVKKKLQLIQSLEQPCTDEAALLGAAMAAHPKKIVIKRPSKGRYFADKKPSYSLEGNGIRFDCHVIF